MRPALRRIVAAAGFAYEPATMSASEKDPAAPAAASRNTPFPLRMPSPPVCCGAVLLALGYVWLCTRVGDWRENALVLASGATLLFSAAALLRTRRRGAGDARPLLPDIVLYGALWAFLFVLLAACVVKVRQVGLPDLIGPFSVNTIEGREAVKAWLMRQGQNIYSPLTDYPFLITLYPPLYFAASAAMTLLTGPGLLAAKLVSLAGLGLMLAMLFALARRATGSRALALFAPLALFLTPEATCGFLCKPDTLAFGLVLAACFCFEGAAAGGAKAGRALGLAAVCLALAGGAKQQSWPLALGLAAYGLAVPGLRRRMPRFLLFAALAGAVLAGGFFLYAGKELFLQTVVFPGRMTALANLNRTATAWTRLAEYATTHAWLLAAYASWLLLCLRRRRLPLADFLALLSLPALFRVLAWSGSDINHFLFFTAVACLGAARLVAACLCGAAPALGLGLVLLAGFQPVNLDTALFSRADFAPTPEAAAQYAAVRNAVAATPGTTLMDAEGAYPFLGRPEFARLRLFDAFETDLYDQLGLLRFAASRIGDDIRARRFERVVDSDVILSTALSSLLSYYYVPERRIGRYTFRVRRPEQAIVAVDAPDDATRENGGLTVAPAQTENVKRFPGHLEGADMAKPYRLVYDVRASAAPQAVTLVVFPRILAPGGELRVACDAGDGEREAARYGYDDTKRSGEGWDNRREVTFAPGADRFKVVVTVTPNAELWFDATHPLAIMARWP